MLRILELFGGIGACSKALERLGIEYEIADYVEIDKYAVSSYNAMHDTNFEPQDICKWDKDIEVDLIMHGSPCQDFSLAGLQAGGDEGSGTRSSLMYETIRIVNKLKPKYVIWENVKNMISKKHIHNFNNYIERMGELGYTSYYQVLNAKDYGIPQNRERVFTISIRNDLNIGYVFPEKKELKMKLKDMLEDNVDEKYYLSDSMIEYLEYGKYNAAKVSNKLKQTDTGICPTLDTMQGGNRQPFIKDNANKVGHIPEWHQRGGIYDSEGISPTLCATDYKTPKLTTIKIKNATKKGYLEASEGDGIDISSRMEYHRGTVQKDSTQTIDTKCNIGVVVKGGKQLNETIEKNIDKFKEGKVLNMDLYNRTVNEELSQTLTDPTHNSQRLFDGLRIRKLTPKECWRLMGFDDSDFDKASKVNSNTQLYKQAGNSIVVNVMEAILYNLLVEPNTKNENIIEGQTTIEDFIND